MEKSHRVEGSLMQARMRSEVVFEHRRPAPRKPPHEDEPGLRRCRPIPCGNWLPRRLGFAISPQGHVALRHLSLHERWHGAVYFDFEIHPGVGDGTRIIL